MVPVELRYWCPGTGRDECAVTAALVDSGAPWAVMPMVCLPAGVGWDDLARVDRLTGRHGTSDTPREVRLWEVDVLVFGVRVVQRVYVTGEDVMPASLVLGLGDLFARFLVTFAWSSTPPVFRLDPVGQAVPWPDALVDPSPLVSEATRRLPPPGGPPNRAARRRSARRSP